MSRQLSVEVSIQFKRKLYHASSSSFPECVGTGISKKDALKDLATKVSKLISEITKESITSILTSDDYVEVILDTEKEKEKEERLVFNLNEPMSSQKNMMVKLKPIAHTPELPVPSVKTPSSLSLQSYKDDLNEQLLELLESPSVEPDGLSFGFPISFN